MGSCLPPPTNGQMGKHTFCPSVLYSSKCIRGYGKKIVTVATTLVDATTLCCATHGDLNHAHPLTPHTASCAQVCQHRIASYNCRVLCSLLQKYSRSWRRVQPNVSWNCLATACAVGTIFLHLVFSGSLALCKFPSYVRWSRAAI